MCFLLLAGQIPGWLHVSTCGESSSVSLNSSDDSSCCSCCSVSYSSSDEPTQKTVVSGADTKHSHDCDSCVICLSLVSHNAAQANSFEFVEYEYLVQPSVEFYQLVVSSKRLSFANPRAPPLV